MDIARQPLIALATALILAAPSDAAAADLGGLIGELLGTGVEIDGSPVKVSPPILSPLQPDQDRTLSEETLGGSRGWKQFTRKSMVGPVYIDLDYLKGADGERVGQRVHFAFVVHADLETIRNDDVMRQMFAGESDSSSSEGFRSASIDRSELEGGGAKLDEASSYGKLELVLLKKVSIHAVIRSERTDGDNYFAVGWRLDEQFSEREPPVASYRNEWSKLDRDELGRPTRGPFQPYAGAAGYMIVSKLDAVEGASLIEAEVILNEPKDWFSGSNLLRSKLPLIIQESARKLRRGLK